jgi:phosphatidylinositol alpha-mannosyltransferase
MWARPALRAQVARLSTRVVVSESALETARANWSEADYVVLWNGIEVERFASAVATPTDRPAAFFIGRHEPRKGLAVLIDAWQQLQRDAVLWVGGTGPDRRVARVSPKEWLARSLTGTQRGCAAHRLVRAVRRGESFGVVCLKAWQLGPVAASAIEGYRNVARADIDVAGPAGDPPASAGRVSAHSRGLATASSRPAAAAEEFFTAAPRRPLPSCTSGARTCPLGRFGGAVAARSTSPAARGGRCRPASGRAGVGVAGWRRHDGDRRSPSR